MKDLNNKNTSQENSSERYKSPSIPTELKEILLTNSQKGHKLAIFFGNGISRLYGRPSWKELSMELVKECFDKKKINYNEQEILKEEKNLKKIITICKHKLGEKAYYALLQKQLKTPDKNTMNKSHLIKKIKSLTDRASITSNTLYITTNIDNDSVSDISEVETNCLDIKTINYQKTYFLHGNIDKKDSIILTTKEYLNHYAPENSIPNFLKCLFTDYNVLFIGYGLEELDILEYLLNKGGVEGSEKLKRFSLTPFLSANYEKIAFEKQYFKDIFEIDIIPFNIDQKGHSQLIQVIEDWIKQMESKISPKTDFENIDLVINNGPK